MGGRPSMDRYLDSAITGPEDGIARFEDFERFLRDDDRQRFFARLPIPRLQDHQVEVDLRTRPLERHTLVKPRIGRVALEFDEDARGVVLLRAPWNEAEYGALTWHRQHPCQAEIRQGRAVFAEVGLGLELQYRAELEDPGLELNGRFAGPRRSGETVCFRPPGVESWPVLVGRVLDEDLVPVASRELCFTVTRTQRSRYSGSTSSRGADVQTDADGRFDFPLLHGIPERGHRYLVVSAPGRVEAMVDLTREIPPGNCELGDLVLAAPGAEKLLGRLGDDGLEAHYREAMHLRSLDYGHQRRVEACLLEMARRGTPLWASFLEAELARIRSEDESVRTDLESGLDLEYLTALRRAQDRPDPLIVTVLGDPPFEATFPEAPAIRCRLENADAGGESFVVTSGGSYRSGRFARCRVDAIAPGGRALTPLPEPGGLGGGGISRDEVLEPGEYLSLHIPLRDYVQFPQPGDYRVRIQYHDNENIDTEATLAGYVVSSSPYFEVRMNPGRLRLSRSEMESMRRWVEEIDVSRPVPLVSGHWHEGLRFTGEPETPEDRIFRAGYRAVPVLLDCLETEPVDAARRGWVLGMLWNITGVNNPAGGRRGTIGSYRWITNWPTAIGRASPTLAEFGERKWKVSAEEQEELVARWSPARRWFEVEVVD